MRASPLARYPAAGADAPGSIAAMIPAAIAPEIGKGGAEATLLLKN